MTGLPENLTIGPFRFRRYYGNDAQNGWSPYLSKLTFRIAGWSIGVHKFHRGDADPDCHDHPFDFWTFPLTSYVEQVAVVTFKPIGEPNWTAEYRIVRAFRLHYRPATYTHRVLGRLDAKASLEYAMGAFVTGTFSRPLYRAGSIWTIVLKRDADREWGFLKRRDGAWCWQHWHDYINAGGKDTGCNDEPRRREGKDRADGRRSVAP